MKKIIKFSCLALLPALFFSACKPDEVFTEQTQQTIPEKFIEFKGMTVRLPEGVSDKCITLENHSELMKFATDFVGKPNARGDGEDFISQFPSLVIMDILQKESKKYPNRIFAKETLDDNVFSRLKKDFPQIKTQKEAIDKSEIIAAYYDGLLRNDLLRELKNYKPGNKRTSYFDGFNPPMGWGWIAILYPATTLVVGIHANNATNFSNSYPGGGHVDGTPSNAFRHSVWNALSVANMREMGYSKNNALAYTRDLTSAYEAVAVVPWYAASTLPSGPLSFLGDLAIIQTRSTPTSMDLSNNLVGRTYVYQNMGFWPWQVPSMPTIYSELLNKSYAIGSASTLSSILGTYNSNTNDAWNILYGWHYDDTYRALVKLQ
jgi:hypothetical protein